MPSRWAVMTFRLPTVLAAVRKLRDFYDSVDSLCDDLDVARESIETSLAGIGYTYDAEKNQFV